VINPAARSLSFIEGAGHGGWLYAGIALGPDGLLYCAPCESSKVLVINPATRELSFIEGAEQAKSKWNSGIAVGPDGLLYCTQGLVINPATQSLIFTAGVGSGYCGITLGPDGLLYCAPSKNAKVAVFGSIQALACCADAAKH